MSNQTALNNLVMLSEILVDVSKSHIMPKEAIDQIRKLDISSMYDVVKKQIELLELYERLSVYTKFDPCFKDFIDRFLEIKNNIAQIRKEIEGTV